MAYIKLELLQQFPSYLNITNAIHGNPYFLKGVETVIEYAENLPRADVEEVKHGHWIVDGDITECSNCHKEYVTARGMLQLKEFERCPKCGAKMDGGNAE